MRKMIWQFSIMCSE